MHSRRLVRNQSGAATDVTNFNGKLKEELELIGATHTNFTLHNWRNQRIKEAGENPTMDRANIKSGASHTNGAHDNNYDGSAASARSLTFYLRPFQHHRSPACSQLHAD